MESARDASDLSARGPPRRRPWPSAAQCSSDARASDTLTAATAMTRSDVRLVHAERRARILVRMIRHRPAARLLILTVSVAGAFPAVRAERQAPGANGADPTAAILAKHKASDEEYAEAVMSPFTAVAVQYFQPGQTIRMGIGPAGVAFGSSPAGVDVVELTLQDGAYSVAPVAGATPTIVKTSGNGDVTGLPGTPVTARTRLERRDVVRVGRYLVETLSAPGNGNARVFDPESPARKAFTGLKWYAPNLALQVKARFVPNPSPTSVTIATSRGLQREYFRVGTFEFAVDGTPLRLTVLATGAAPKNGDELFVAFRDATTAQETYDIGRYLFVPFAGADAAYVLDFNLATNPLCNYSPHYNCPIPPRENVLPVPIRAGEMKYPVHH
jgi:uncharacterized protein